MQKNTIHNEPYIISTSCETGFQVRNVFTLRLGMWFGGTAMDSTPCTHPPPQHAHEELECVQTSLKLVFRL